MEYLVYLRVSTVPVTMTLVTLEVQSPGGNNSVSLVYARYCQENNPDKRTGLYINLDVAESWRLPNKEICLIFINYDFAHRIG